MDFFRFLVDYELWQIAVWIGSIALSVVLILWLDESERKMGGGNEKSDGE